MAWALAKSGLFPTPDSCLPSLPSLGPRLRAWEPWSPAWSPEPLTRTGASRANCEAASEVEKACHWETGVTEVPGVHVGGRAHARASVHTARCLPMNRA